MPDFLGVCARIKPERIGISVCKQYTMTYTFSTHQIYILEQKHQKDLYFFREKEGGAGCSQKGAENGRRLCSFSHFWAAEGASTWCVYDNIWVGPPEEEQGTYIHGPH